MYSKNKPNRRRSGVAIVSKIRRTRAVAYGDPALWAQISEEVKRRDGYKCTKCGTPKQPGVKLEVHHIVPVARGGRTVGYNMRTLCDSCHRKMPFHNHLRK